MNKLKLIIILMMCIACVAFALGSCGTDTEALVEESDETYEESTSEETEEGDSGINLRDIYGGGSNYLFTYNGENFDAIYHYDNWCIYNSYKITDTKAMKEICQALIDEHPVHGSDYESYRTVDDMVYEWKQHNIAYAMLPDDSSWKTTTGNVDFDPEDQGKSLDEIYEARTGEKFDLSEHKDDLKEYIKRMLE